MSRATVSLSAQLIAANQRLSDLRSQTPGCQAQPTTASVSPCRDVAVAFRPNSPPSWLHSLTQAIAHPVQQAAKQPSSNSANATISFFPDIGLALLRQQQEAIGRIWLLLRHCDAQGRGWIEVNEARALLTKKDAPLRACGWRQLRNLLRAGQGIFWQRNQERIWLRSTAKVAAALGIERVENRPISLPIKTLLGGIGTVRAHFYASFHSGRHADSQSKPIARETLTMLSRVGRDSQRSYERQTDLTVRFNFALGQLATQQTQQAAGWEIGQHVFTLTDQKGNYGKPGASYVAWQLPNSYAGVHDQQPRRRRRRINRKLVDLLDQGTMGNDKLAMMQRYCSSHHAAADTEQTKKKRYWQDTSSKRKNSVWRLY